MTSAHRRLGLLATALLLAACERAEEPAQQAAAPAAPETPASADTVLRGGAIYTVDAARSWAQAVALREGKIVFVGTDAGANALIGPQTQVIDLDGRLVLPGLQDAHIHPISGGMEAAACDLNGARTAEEYVLL